MPSTLRSRWLAAASACLLLCCLYTSVLSVSANAVTVYNGVRLDTKGRPLNAHDGGISFFDGLYHLYGDKYMPCSQKGPTCDGVCGYLNNSFALYTSPDLQTWTLVSDNIMPSIFPDNQRTPYWMPNVYKHPRTGKYVMLYRDNNLQGSLVAFAEADVAAGPFIPRAAPIALAGTTQISSTVGLFMDSQGRAWVRANTADAQGRRHFIELLDDDWKNTTGRFVVVYRKDTYPWYEGGGLMERNGYFYLLLGTDCCYCQYGSNGKVWVSEFNNMLGNWTYQGDMIPCADGTESPDPIDSGLGRNNLCSMNDMQGQNFSVPAQPFNLVTLQPSTVPGATQYLYFGELFRTAPDGLKGHDLQAWLPIEFDDTLTPPRMRTIRMVDSFVIQVNNTKPVVKEKSQPREHKIVRVAQE